MSDTSAAKQEWFGHPRGLSTLFFTELWERLSYYGMRAILVLFMVDAIQTGGFGMTDGRAAAIYGLYTAGVYFLALPGGWIADRLLGQQKAVFLGGCLIAAGHFSMALPIIPGLDVLSKPSFYGGLILIVLGTGLLKPNVSSIVGDLYPDKGARRDAGFSIFYMGINIGAFAGPLICGYLGEDVDWHLGFSTAGFGMLIGLIQYKYGQKFLGTAGTLKEEPEDVRKGNWTKLWAAIGAVVLTCLVLYGLSDMLGLTVERVAHVLGVTIGIVALVYFGCILIFVKLTRREQLRVVVIFLLFVGAALFWSGFEQAGSSMNLFAERYTYREYHLSDWEQSVAQKTQDVLVKIYNPEEKPEPVGKIFLVPASWLQSVNPLFIIIFAPLMGWLWVALGRFEPSIPFKFGSGLALLGAGFLVMAWGSTYIPPELQAAVAAGGETDISLGVSANWLIVTYFLHTIGELCLSPVGLSSVTKLAPHRLVGQMMGTWFMGAALGNLIAGLVAGRIESMPLPELFGTVATIVIVSGGAFILFTIPIKRLIGDLKSDSEE